MKIYVASRWNNKHFPPVIALLRDMGHTVYDFRDNGFNWQELLPGHHVDHIHPALHQRLLAEVPCINAFTMDMKALKESNVVVMVCPCGNSAHLEAGWAVGAGKELIIFQPDPQRPDVMYKLGTLVTNPCALRATMVDLMQEEELRKGKQGNTVYDLRNHTTTCDRCGHEYEEGEGRYHVANGDVVCLFCKART